MAASRSQKIGLYGGTFDPIHHGHLILGRDAVETLGLDRLIFIPAAVSPHKLAAVPGAGGEARRAMLAAALAGEPRFALDDRELRRTGPSYTFDTVAAIRGELPGEMEIFYLIGEDNLALLHTWHRIDELRALARFVVFRREDTPAPADLPAATPRTDRLLIDPTLPRLSRLVDISATEIRKRVASGQSIRYLIPEAVAGLIESRGLYRAPCVPPLPT